MAMQVDANPTMPLWFAVRTKSRQEKMSATMLDSLGVDYYLPLQTEVRQWSDRKQAVSIPLFSGYVFLRMTSDGAERKAILRVPGIVGFVGNKEGPSPIPNYEIEYVRTALAGGTRCSVVPPIQIGERVRVFRGALEGLEGVLVRSNSGSRLVICVEMIQQSIAIAVSQDDVVSVRTGSPHSFTGPFPYAIPQARDVIAG
jgi:transcription antitermination factor NusG